jgi:type IV pilus assembly protein PilB
MTISKNEKPRGDANLWNLEKTLGISIWDNYLTIPQSNKAFLPSEISLQQKLNFVYIKGEDIEDLVRVFISEKTDFMSLSQYLPFLFPKFQCYLCNSQLIGERLSYLDHRESFSADNKATRQLSTLLEEAARKSASDLHLENHSFKKNIRMRIDGRLESLTLKEEVEDALFQKIKLISKMDIAKKRTPQDGHFPYTTSSGKRFDMRTSTIPAVTGEKIVIRLLPASTVRFSMGKLGFSNSQTPLIRKHISKKSGLILFTGPTGSGKTTSLYAILNELISDSLNIVTIEDPVEYRLDSVTQVQVNEQAGVTFSRTLRAFLRQDPDVILIGEIRDQETAQIAARAAQTGHLVLSTLHSNDVFETIRRLKNLGVENDDISSSLSLVISQRLVQQNCECGGNSQCKVCSGSGVSGRVPIMEILELSPELRRLISTGKPLAEIRQQALDGTYQPLLAIGRDMVKNGKISSKELDTICID